MTDPRPEVQRRRVFYIPGYDPMPPRRYRELYRTEGAAQAGISGYDLRLTPKRGEGAYGWQVSAVIDGARVESDVEVLVWSDIVQASMSDTLAATYWQMVRTAWTYIPSGVLRRLMLMRKGPVIAALYPVGVLLLQLLVAILAGWAAHAVLALLSPWIGVVAQVLGAVAWIAVIWAVLRWFRRQDGRLYAYYLMHDYAFSARHRGANPPELEARMAAFRAAISEALRAPVDEVLVVGHSSGAHLAVSILADLLRAGAAPSRGPKLALLTLGQVIPMVSFLPEAHRLRADLAYLSTRRDIAWVDVSAPGDGCSFALCDPVAVSGVAPEGKRWPLVFSAQFSRTLSPERLRALRWRFFRLHFQYLRAFDRPRDYDYFRITAGPMTLASRYAERPPSNSRIDIPVSKYTSTAP
ncbi:hypothetical protein [Salipiger sp.]|uniref:hypothetical protein n=1 Tax=Salipiger sp. TaxID=2078585 RepID=UPI003A96FDAB